MLTKFRKNLYRSCFNRANKLLNFFCFKTCSVVFSSNRNTVSWIESMAIYGIQRVNHWHPYTELEHIYLDFHQFELRMQWWIINYNSKNFYVWVTIWSIIRWVLTDAIGFKCIYFSISCICEWTSRFYNQRIQRR